MSQQNWRTEVDAGDYFGHQKKTLQVADRRPVIRKASDLVGPGIATSAIRITDFNNVLATFDGYYSADVGAASAPNPTDMFVGHVEMDPVFGGKQTFTSLQSGEDYTRVFLRSPSDPDSISWGAWRCSDHVPPSIYNVGPINTTSVFNNASIFLLTPDVQTFGTDGTFHSTAASIGVDRPGVYSGWLRIRASSAACIADTLTVVIPEGAGINSSLTFRTVPLFDALWVPLHFWTSLSNAYIQVQMTQTTGVTQLVTWSVINLSRIGDSPN